MQAVIIFFLAVPFFSSFTRRSYRRGRRAQEGLAWLPLLALGITIGIYPAYGFRPECLPIMLFVLTVNVINLFSMHSGNIFYDYKPLALFGLVFLTAAALPMFIFSPRSYPRDITASVSVHRVELFNREYFIRVYEPAENGNPDLPVIVLVPPEIGSAVSADIVCTELSGQGYTVVTYFRTGFDTPLIDENGRKRLVSPVKLLQYWRIFNMAASRSSLNEMGKSLEAERRIDIVFLLYHLTDVLGKDRQFLLAGYGAGGSALAYLAGDQIFVSLYENVLGVIAIESRLWSAFQDEPRHESQRPVEGWSRSITMRIGNWFRDSWSVFTAHLLNLGPRKVVRTGPLPAENFDNGLPVLYLVSGRALENNQSYQAVFDALRAVSASTALAAIESAGPLDYQDFPFTHPIISFVLPGMKNSRKSTNPVNDTAAIISNFASYLIGSSSRQDINGRVYVESRGLPGFRL